MFSYSLQDFTASWTTYFLFPNLPLHPLYFPNSVFFFFFSLIATNTCILSQQYLLHPPLPLSLQSSPFHQHRDEIFFESCHFQQMTFLLYPSTSFHFIMFKKLVLHTSHLLALLASIVLLPWHPRSPRPIRNNINTISLPVPLNFLFIIFPLL